MANPSSIFSTPQRTPQLVTPPEAPPALEGFPENEDDEDVELEASPPVVADEEGLDEVPTAYELELEAALNDREAQIVKLQAQIAELDHSCRLAENAEQAAVARYAALQGAPIWEVGWSGGRAYVVASTIEEALAKVRATGKTEIITVKGAGLALVI